MRTNENNIVEGDTVTVAQLAIENPGALAVFTKYNIDYCCGGHRSLQEACNRVGMDPEKVKAEIYKSQISDPNENIRPENWTSTFLADYIVQNHHAYVKKAIPELELLLDRVCDRHGSDSPELLSIRRYFLDLAGELTMHMQKEEVVLFPSIKKLESFEKGNGNETLLAPIEVMEHEHLVAGGLIKAMRALSNNFTPPEFACPTFTITFKRLREFDHDLMRHIHFENNILFERFKPCHSN